MRLYGAYLFDLDGTVYRGEELCRGSVEAIQFFLDQGSSIRYLTNNSTTTPDKASEKLRQRGIPCEPEWVITSAKAAAHLCISQGIECVATLGEPSLTDQLEIEGIRVVGGTEGSRAGALVAGLCRSITYEKLSDAMRLVIAGAKLIATNKDERFPLPGGEMKPGAGAIISALETCTGHEAMVAGKPSPVMAQIAMNSSCNSPSETLMVGDSMTTDIACGESAGCDTYLVLSGITHSLPLNQAGGADLEQLMRQTSV